MVARHEVVQGVLDLFDGPSYLEIGVDQGQTFHAVRAARKVGVDPSMNFDLALARSAHADAIYHQVPSDVYFGEIIAADEAFDVAFIDGLHTFEQTLRDLLNVLRWTKPTGVIIIDDILPSSYAASLPDRADSLAMGRMLDFKKNPWMGDVYRLVFFIESFLQPYSFRSIQENHGQLILWRQPRAANDLAPRGVEAVARLRYADAVIEHAAYRFAPLADILQEVAQAIAAPPSVRARRPA